MSERPGGICIDAGAHIASGPIPRGRRASAILLSGERADGTYPLELSSTLPEARTSQSKANRREAEADENGRHAGR
jgi:hypothetical protein